MVTFIKILVTGFMIIASIILFFLWLILGSLLLIALLIRLIALYTVALLNTFVSGNPLTYDYSKAIEDVVNMYISTFTSILNMPKLPWIPLENKENITFRSLLPNELKELKKSWYITLIVFCSYILTFGISLSFLVHNDNAKLEEQFKTELKISNANEEKYKAESKKTEVLLDEFASKLDSLNSKIKKVANIKLRAGKNSSSGNGGYDKEYKMFFELYEPILLRYLYVRPSEKGQISIQLFDFNDYKIAQKTVSLSNKNGWNKVILNFKILKTGKYYLSYEGSPKLWYNSNEFNYSLYSNDILRITGAGKKKTDYNNKSYYEYFYDWTYSLLLEE